MKQKNSKKIFVVAFAVIIASTFALFSNVVTFEKTAELPNLNVLVEESDDIFETNTDADSSIDIDENGSVVVSGSVYAMNPGELYSKAYSIRPENGEFTFDKLKLSMSETSIEDEDYSYVEGYNDIVETLDADRRSGQSNITAKDGINGTFSRVLLFDEDMSQILEVGPGEEVSINDSYIKENQELKIVHVVYLGVGYNKPMEEISHSYDLSFLVDGSDK